MTDNSMPSLTMIENLSHIIMRNTEDIVSYLENFVQNNNYDDDKVYKCINELDIQKKLKSIINYIEKAQYVNSFVKNEVEGIKEIIVKIEDQLNIINERLKYNKSLWILSSYRKYNFNNRINELSVLMSVLCTRLNTLNYFTTINNLVQYRTILGPSFD